jgi:hypothetical protein
VSRQSDGAHAQPLRFCPKIAPERLPRSVPAEVRNALLLGPADPAKWSRLGFALARALCRAGLGAEEVSEILCQCAWIPESRRARFARAAAWKAASGW